LRRGRAPLQPAAVLPKRLRLVPSETLDPNYFVLGTEGDDVLLPIGRQPDTEEGPAPSRRRPPLTPLLAPRAAQRPAPKARRASRQTPAVSTTEVAMEASAGATSRRSARTSVKPVTAIAKGRHASESTALAQR